MADCLLSNCYTGNMVSSKQAQTCQYDSCHPNRDRAIPAMSNETRVEQHAKLPGNDSQLRRESRKIFQIMAGFVEGFERLGLRGLPRRLRHTR